MGLSKSGLEQSAPILARVLVCSRIARRGDPGRLGRRKRSAARLASSCPSASACGADPAGGGPMYQILPPGLRALEHGGPCHQGPPCCLALQGHGTIARPLRPPCAERPGTASGVRPAPLGSGARSPPIRNFYPACDLRRLTGEPLRRFLRAVLLRRAATPALFHPLAGGSAAGASRRIGVAGARLARAGHAPAPQRRGPISWGSAAADPREIERPRGGRSSPGLYVKRRPGGTRRAKTPIGR